jgi:hypothetical protein
MYGMAILSFRCKKQDMKGKRQKAKGKSDLERSGGTRSEMDKGKGGWYEIERLEMRLHDMKEDLGQD